MSESIEELAWTIYEAFQAGGTKRVGFLDTFSTKVGDQFWAEMRSWGGNAIERPSCAPEDWHRFAREEVLDWARKLIELADLEPIQAETIMAIAQVTVDTITGVEVNQHTRKWIGLELLEESLDPNNESAGD